MKVKLIYRNYKSLHQAYTSMVDHPPEGVTYIVPVVNAHLRKLHKLYRKARFAAIAKPLIRLAERILFINKSSDDDADIYQYLNIISEKPVTKPYIVDTEHAAGLIGFTQDDKRLKTAQDFLLSPMCMAVTCWSKAAARTLKQLMGDKYDLVAPKVDVIYPAVEEVKGLKPDYEFIKQGGPALKLLLVGNQAYLKGTQELLEAIKKINQKYSNDRVELHIISDDAAELVRQYNLANVKLYQPIYAKKDVLQKFYMPADVFIMPTKQDTYGLALLDALACGTPVITTNQFASREIVDNGKDGILLKLDNPIMDSFFVPGKAAMDSVMRPNLNNNLAEQIYLSLVKIIDAKTDIKQMGLNGQKKFKKGQIFSIDVRKRKLEKIYKKAMAKRADA